MEKCTWLLICFMYVVTAAKINDKIVIKNAERTINLASQLVNITATLTVENTGKDKVKHFLIVLEPNVAAASYINVKDLLENDLEILPVKVEGHENKTFYNVVLKEPINESLSTTLILEEVLTKHLEPYPSSIAQKDKQLVRYFGNHYFYSPYIIKKQNTNVLLGSRMVENYTKLKPVTQADSTITYGPYTNIQPFTVDEMMVHFENHSPFLTVTKLDRTIEVSHWGTITVKEDIEVYHSGAKLVGSFSRYDFQRDTGSSHPSIKSYYTSLPASAYDIYYRDGIGNISTSAVKLHDDWTELELRPRFPLFGGWRTAYTLGYSVPSVYYLFKNSDEAFVLRMRLLDHVFNDMHIEELVTSIILPVGVFNVHVKTPYPVESLQDDIVYRYTENLGRHVVKLRKTNLVEKHIQNFEITYNWKQHFILHEPLLISCGLFLLFLIVIIYIRIDFSLKTEHSKKD